MAYKVVLADSSPSVQKVVQLAFSGPDFEVTTIEDGNEVLNKLRPINPDAILLSLSLPAKDGYELVRQLRNLTDFQKTGLILLKSAFEPLDVEKIEDLEFDVIVQKPFDSEKLVQTVRDIIDRKKGPATYPEEALIEEVPLDGAVPLFKEEEFAPPPMSSLPKEDVDEKLRRMLQEEILEVERELEKRLKAALLAELRDWMERGKRTP